MTVIGIGRRSEPRHTLTRQFTRAMSLAHRRMRFLLALAVGLSCFPGEIAGKSPRHKRYLVYPPPADAAPTKVQMIMGLGLPMEVDVSLIIGYVMKFNYALPYNASYLTDPYVRYDRSIGPEHGNVIPTPTIGEDQGKLLTRWDLYDVLSSLFGTEGKACLLRMICQVADVPINRSHGICGQLLHLLLTPSSTSEPIRTEFDREYFAAEVAGRQTSGRCDNLFPECPDSLLEYFTEIFE